jgi:succinoglycan biosynthesis transport protein ExoP
LLPTRAVSGVSSSHEAGGELREYWQVFVERRSLIIACALLACAVAWLFIVLATPMFTAEALLRIDRLGPNVIDIESVDGESIQLGGADDYYNTQFGLLASRMLAARVLGELSIRESAHFLVAGGVAPPAREREDAVVLVDRYLRQLVVEPVAQSRLVKLRFSAADPELATRIVRTHARTFIRYGLDVRAQASSEAAAVLGESLDGLRRKVEIAQEALGEFRRGHDIVSLDDKADVVIDRLEDINQRLTAAQSDRIAREADLRLARQRSYETLPAVIDNELIRTLKQELAPIERDYRVLLPTVTSSYYGLEVLRARMEQAQRRIDVEIDNIVKGIESAYLAARQREAEASSQLEREKKAALQLKDDSVRYAILKQDVEAALSLYDSVRKRAEEATIVGGLPGSNVSVVDEAYVRAKPSSPRKAEVLILGSLLGVFAGLGLALLLDLFGGKLDSERDVRRRLRLPLLGIVPSFHKGDRRGRAWRRWLNPWKRRARPALADERPPESVLEGYRSIRNAIVLSKGEGSPLALLVCSAREKEGATTTALELAIALSKLGPATLLIDANLRRPGLHGTLRVAGAPGLTEMLVGDPAEIHPISIGDRALYFLPSGARVADPNDLLASARMRETLAKLREQFEYIVVDGAPLAAWTDSRVLASRVDGVVLVVDGRKTPWTAASEACDGLRASRGAILGVILNRIGSAEKRPRSRPDRQGSD